jgi:F-type H+-transporting ATPase subunit a
MRNLLRNFFIISFLTIPAFSVYAKADPTDGAPFEASKMILHHIADDYSWHFWDYTDANGEAHHVSLPLPVILWTNGHLDVFMSSAFHHGKDQVVMGDRVYRLDHGHVVEANGASVLDFSFTKNVASMFLGSLILVLVFSAVGRAYTKRPGQAPSGLQAFMEPLILFIRDGVVVPNVGEKHYKRFLPYLLTLFFFIWINNLLGLIPSGANASGNISFTFTLAVFTLVLTTISGTKDYWGHIFNMPGVPKLMLLIMIPVEIIGIFTKPFALMIRLFANITAGHIVILSLVSFIFLFKNVLVGVPVGIFVVAITFLELFVAALQAYIFTLLTALFIGLALEEHEHEHHDEKAQAAHH